MSGLTISSGVSVNGGGNTSRFATFTIGDLIHAMRPEILTTMAGVPGVPRPAVFTFQGGGLMAKNAQLSAVVCDGVFGGGTRRNSANYLEAVAMAGELVHASVDYNGANHEGWGILTDLNLTLGPGNVSQTIVVTFWPCDRLRHAMSNNYYEPGGS